MAELTPGEPQSAGDYDDRTTAAVKTVLIEIGQILGSFKGKYAVVGGAVPWLLLGNEEMPHVGTLDVDLGLDVHAPLRRRNQCAWRSQSGAMAAGGFRAGRCLVAIAGFARVNAMATQRPCANWQCNVSAACEP